MRSLAESTSRWQETLNHSANLADLKRAVKFSSPNSPCVAGCRSVCWKAFLLSGSTNDANWSHTLLESRSTYASIRDHFLKYIKHPEYLASAASDPLADDTDSPWNTLRQDELLRAEILQDVQRLPDEPFYHRPEIQTLILDVLFIYCKLNPDVGGYRQGMHELLAPIVYVVEQDAIDPVDAASDASAELKMVEMLDASFIEHDSYALFSKVMDRAKSFYEIGEDPKRTSFGSFSQKSSIVERSQHIHEVCLYKVDPDLSNHLKNIEVLPQIFLIRWIRLLFSREFPFEKMLVLWDTLFAVDPSLDLVDLICTAMLIRVRWELLEADYSTALQMLLKYPAPQEPHGPHTFVDDAFFLKDHLDLKGGSTLIMKYTGKLPSSPTTTASAAPKTANARQRLAGLKSPLSPSRFIPAQGGVEALFQGAAKNVLQRGEKLGINQAVRDAMLEIRRNVHEARKAGRELLSEPTTAMKAVAAMDRRNKQLAAMLSETVSSLKTLATSDIEDKTKYSEALEIEAAKIQFVQAYLEDSTIELPEEISSTTSPSQDKLTSIEEAPSTPGLPTDAVAAMVISTPDMAVDSPRLPEVINTPKIVAPETPTKSGHPISEAMDTDAPSEPADSVTDPLSVAARPHGPIPTRSTLAQSSFSWMLEPDVSSSGSSGQASSAFSSKPPASASHRKRPSANANRERTAFLFGEVPSDPGQSEVLPEDIFGLEPLKKNKGLF